MVENKKVTIVTHNSGFHTDDIFAVATLLLVLGESIEVEIIRSRDMSIIEKADYVVDVGGVHNPDRNRFDHHQEGGAGRRENAVPYASFGLVWKKYGEVLSGNTSVLEKIDKMIVQPIDANDNGVSFLETKISDLHPFDIGLMTFLFYPTWKEDIEKIDDIFLDLVSYAKFLLNRIIASEKDRVEAESFVLNAYNSSSDKRLIVLDNSRFPWGEVLAKFPEPLYVIYKSITDDTWAIKCVRSDLHSYVNRKKLPESWAGKKNQELEKITGIEGSVFCHNNRFMAVAKTKEAILQLAEIALNS